jgi:chemotaxis protein methyltransferase CheR
VNPVTVVRDDYADFCEGINSLCAIELAQYKRNQMERRIRSFAAHRGAGDLGHYLRVLHGDHRELEAFLERMTINVSQLWRNPEQWAMLAEKVLPELAAGGQIRAWSAGASYGAEAYTLAAVCREAAPNAHIDIRGTDIDRHMVVRARDGEFTESDARSAPAASLARWFEPYAGGWRARNSLKAATTFDVGDLLRISPLTGAYDLVLCRNTVIYFTADVRDELHARLAQSLRPGGYLMVGNTERVTSPAALGLEIAHPFTYRKV